MRTTNAVFSTLTITRAKNKTDSWNDINKLSNRYVQRIRRKINHCEYLQAFEEHSDGYPHVHLLFLFRDYRYAKNNTRWLPTTLFERLKSQWTHGLSDHQQPYANSDYSSLKYILKYVSKTSATHLWSKLLPTSYDIQPVNTNELGYPIKSPQYAKYKSILVCKEKFLDRTDLKLKKIKLLSWSRNFVPEYLKTINS